VNKLYVYSLTPIANGYTIFVLENALPVPFSHLLLDGQLPAFLGWLWNVNIYFKTMINQIDTFVEISKEEQVLQVDSQPSSTSSSQESNASKKNKVKINLIFFYLFNYFF
jgi:hypothetical protein